MSPLPQVFRSCVVPAALAVTGLSAAAVLVLDLADAPAGAELNRRVEPILLRVLFGTGCALPLALVLRPRRRPVGPGLALAAFLAAALAHAVVLDAQIRVAPQGLFSLLAVLLGLGMGTLALFVWAEAREAPARPRRL